MDTKKYRAKPTEVEAVQVTEQNILQVAAWCKGTAVQPYWVKVPTLHGHVIAVPGDWVAKGPQDFYPIDAKAFANRWEEVPALTSRQATGDPNA